MTFLWISREDKTKWKLIIRIGLVFLYVDSKFDMPKCKYALKNNSFNILIVFSPIFVAERIILLKRTQNSLKN